MVETELGDSVGFLAELNGETVRYAGTFGCQEISNYGAWRTI